MLFEYCAGFSFFKGRKSSVIPYCVSAIYLRRNDFCVVIQHYYSVFVDEVHSRRRPGEGQYSVRDAESGKPEQDHIQGLYSSITVVYPIVSPIITLDTVVRRGCSGLVPYGGGRYRSGSLC